MPSQIVTLTVNGSPRELIARPSTTLLRALRENLGLTGTKRGCSQGACGTCTVLLDGEPVVSCLVPVVNVDGAEVTTVEGLAGPDVLMSSCALLRRTPTPTRDEVCEGLSGNVCRCTGYEPIVAAVLDAAQRTEESQRTSAVPAAEVGS